MNNKEFISALSRKTGYKIDDTQRMIRSAVSIVTETLVDGDSVMMSKLGTFDVKKRLERVIVNPSSGQRMLVPPKLVVNFKPVSSAKDRVKGKNNE